MGEGGWQNAGSFLSTKPTRRVHIHTNPPPKPHPIELLFVPTLQSKYCSVSTKSLLPSASWRGVLKESFLQYRSFVQILAFTPRHLSWRYGGKLSMNTLRWTQSPSWPPPLLPWCQVNKLSPNLLSLYQWFLIQLSSTIPSLRDPKVHIV